MTMEDVFNFEIEISAMDSIESDIDRMTRNLLAELRETDVESVELVSSGSAPVGTKTADPITTGAIAISVLPTVLPKIVELIHKSSNEHFMYSLSLFESKLKTFTGIMVQPNDLKIWSP